MSGAHMELRKQMSLPPSLQHRTDLGPSREDRRLESGHSTNGYSSGRERLSNGARHRPRQAAYKPNHPLMGEIERLLASCESHEREIRAAQNTINHQLAEWAGKFDTLHELDTKAEQMAFDVKKKTKETSEEHSEMIDRCVRDAQGWVAETRDNMQLWKQDERDREVSDVNDEKKEVVYTWKQWEAQIELVKRQYENEQERMDRLIADKQRSQKRKNSWTCGILGTLVMAVMVIWILLWMFEWRLDAILLKAPRRYFGPEMHQSNKRLSKSILGFSLFFLLLPSTMSYLVPGWFAVRVHTKERIPSIRRRLETSSIGTDGQGPEDPVDDDQGGSKPVLRLADPFDQTAPIYDIEWIKRYTDHW